jgi:ABC-type spermidine/putrescine transport system permease subunit II
MGSRWTWRLLALPGVLWLAVFFLVAFYAVIAVAFGNQNTLSEPVPFWNPLDWNVGYMLDTLQNIWNGDQFLTVFVRTFVFVAIALVLSLLIGYPVAYFAARHAGRWRGLVLLLLILPFWINYLMRMLAWINLLSPDGLGTRFLSSIGIERLFISADLLSARGGWLEGQPFTVIMALTYGYLPFLILPLYAALDRIDQRQIEAARDLGASPAGAFRRVTLPLSRPGILAGLVLIALPMFGDYYTPDLVSSSTKTTMIGNQIDQLTRQGSEKVVGASLTLILAGLRRSGDGMSRLRNPWGKPRFLVLVTVVYILWSLIPVAIAVMFAFNNGRSRTTWQGFSTRWFTGASGSVLHDPALQGALKHTLFLGVVCVLIATPLGVALALGLQRWRGPGGGTINTVMLLPLVTPEIVMGVALLLLFLQVLPGIGVGSTAQAIGQVTFTLSYVVVIVRGRLVSIGKDYEEAAADLGAPPHDQLFRVLIPLLAPAIIASAAVVFAISLDDFVVTQYLSGDASTTTVSMLLYASARAAPTPALNALATIALLITLLTLGLAYAVYRRFASSDDATAMVGVEV